MTNFFFLSLILAFNYSSSQTKPTKEYFEFIQKADSFYVIKDYKNSHLNYTNAFRANNDFAYVKDRYNAACSWALDNRPDSAFYQLYRIATKGNFGNYLNLTNDKDLISLHNDKRWLPLLNLVKNNTLGQKN